MKELYQHLENSFVKCQPFLGVSTKQLQYHAIPTLTNESPKKKKYFMSVVMSVVR